MSRADTDAPPRSCEFCGELMHSDHIWCRPSQRPRAPMPHAWPVAREDAPGARRAAAASQVRGLLQQIGDEATFLVKQLPQHALESLDDRRVRWSAVERLEDLARELAQLVQRTKVARDG
jgi:hypothetical protein